MAAMSWRARRTVAAACSDGTGTYSPARAPLRPVRGGRSWVSLLGLPAGDAGDDQRGEDDAAVERADPLGGDAGQRQHVLDHVEQQDAGEGAEDGAFAAVEGDSAD